MGEVQHSSIGKNAQKVAIVEEGKAQRREELIARFVETPWHKYRLDQLTVWVLWATLAASLFLFCTVSAVVWAVR